MTKKKQKQGFEFTAFVEGDHKKPFITLWVNVSTYQVSAGDDDNEPYSYRGTDAEDLEDYGVSLGIYKGRHYTNRSRSLNEEHIGFMPAIGDSVWMVIEDHRDGDTFGNTDHVFYPMRVFKTFEEADAWIKSPEGKSCEDSGYFGGHNDWIIKKVVVS